MNCGPSLKKTPRSLGKDNPTTPLLRTRGRGRSLGTAWIWRAVAPEYRLRLASIVGNRTLYSARRLLRRVRQCLDGSLPLFTSDALRHYADVLLELFGVWDHPRPTGRRGRPRNPRRVAPPALRYAQVQKHRQHGRVVAVTRRVVFGQPDRVQAEATACRRANGRKGQLNTAYVERDNLTLRQTLRRLTRKTLGFSKNRRELQRALDFIDAHANFVRPHASLRIRANEDTGRRWLWRTPAMAAGRTDHRWTLEELLCYKPVREPA